MDRATRQYTEIIHEGRYAAEVDIELHDSDESWSPTMFAGDAKKLEAVRSALRRDDIVEAGKHARLFELKPISV